jgi:putative effector of murein hydrolase LrgA (UPF0299 family)
MYLFFIPDAVYVHTWLSTLQARLVVKCLLSKAASFFYILLLFYSFTSENIYNVGIL